MSSEPPKQLIKCHECGKAGPPCRCTSCMCAYFCGVKCQKKAWKEHRTECVSIRNRKENDLKMILKAGSLLLERMKLSMSGFTCAVCLDENKQSELRLDCGHTYCYTCIKDVQLNTFLSDPSKLISELISIAICPVCRSNVPIIEGLVLNRSLAFQTLASSCEDLEQRDFICSVALDELSVILQHEPANWSIWQEQGRIYVIMERYKEAFESFYKAYNAFLFWMKMPRKPTSVESMKRTLATEPGMDFDVDAIDDAIMDVMGIGFCIFLGDAFIKNGDFEIADKLLARADKKVNSHRNTNEWWKYSHMDYEILVARSECCLGLGKYDMATKLQKMACHGGDINQGSPKYWLNVKRHVETRAKR